MSKRKSEKRFEQLRHIAAKVIPTLPGGKGKSPSTDAAVLVACWYFARGENCEFNATKGQIAEFTRLEPRRVQRALARLETAGVIETIRVGAGHYGSHRRVTGQPFIGGESNEPPQGRQMKHTGETNETERGVK